MMMIGSIVSVALSRTNFACAKRNFSDGGPPMHKASAGAQLCTYLRQTKLAGGR